jgi:hypothetical protein
MVHRAHHREGRHDHDPRRRQVVAEWTQPADWNGTKEFAGRRIAAGTIGLQAHDPRSVVYYKNIRIKVLD